jgi:hypothetical protein
MAQTDENILKKTLEKEISEKEKKIESDIKKNNGELLKKLNDIKYIYDNNALELNTKKNEELKKESSYIEKQAVETGLLHKLRENEEKYQEAIKKEETNTYNEIKKLRKSLKEFIEETYIELKETKYEKDKETIEGDLNREKNILEQAFINDKNIAAENRDRDLQDSNKNQDDISKILNTYTRKIENIGKEYTRKTTNLDKEFDKRKDKIKEKTNELLNIVHDKQSVESDKQSVKSDKEFTESDEDSKINKAIKEYNDCSDSDNASKNTKLDELKNLICNQTFIDNHSITTFLKLMQIIWDHKQYLVPDKNKQNTDENIIQKIFNKDKPLEFVIKDVVALKRKGGSNLIDSLGDSDSAYSSDSINLSDSIDSLRSMDYSEYAASSDSSNKSVYSLNSSDESDISYLSDSSVE